MGVGKSGRRCLPQRFTRVFDALRSREIGGSSPPALTNSKLAIIAPKERVMTQMKIFGEHDDRTKEQMWRCMAVGSVAGGVLCADGHLGYAQPVGGVIAYESHVSV